MTILFSSLAGGASGRLMPKYVVKDSLITLKTAVGNVVNSSNSTFYTALQLDFSSSMFDTATLQVTADTTEQTLVDTGTGKSGVLTQILSPKMSAPGDMTVRVTLDGKVTTFIANLPVADDTAMCIGDFVNWAAATNTTVGTAGGSNVGYAAPETLQQIAMVTPLDSVSRGLIAGMKFTDSMKITVQGEFNLTAGSTSHKAAAAWLTYIPEGA